MPDRAKVAQLIASLNISQGTRKTSDELKEIISVFIQDCRSMTNEQFEAAITEFRRKNRWFPTTFDIISKHNELQRSKMATDKRLYLPFPELKPEQIAENIRRCRQIKEMLAKKFTINR